jgi:hypothetical protein
MFCKRLIMNNGKCYETLLYEYPEILILLNILCLLSFCPGNIRIVNFPEPVTQKE